MSKLPRVICEKICVLMKAAFRGQYFVYGKKGRQNQGANCPQITEGDLFSDCLK